MSSNNYLGHYVDRTQAINQLFIRLVIQLLSVKEEKINAATL